MIFPVDESFPEWRRRKLTQAFAVLRCYAEGDEETIRRGAFDAGEFLEWMRHEYRPKRRPGQERLGERAAWRYFTVLAHAWKRWRKAGHVPRDPFALYLDKRYTSDEFEGLVRRIPETSAGRQRLVAILRVGREFQLTIGALTKLRIDDYDREKKRFRIKGEWRDLSPATARALENYVTRGRQLSLRDAKEKALFIHRYCGRVMTSAAIDKAIAAHGIRWEKVVERYRLWVSI